MRQLKVSHPLHGRAKRSRAQNACLSTIRCHARSRIVSENDIFMSCHAPKLKGIYGLRSLGKLVRLTLVVSSRYLFQSLPSTSRVGLLNDCVQVVQNQMFAPPIALSVGTRNSSTRKYVRVAPARRRPGPQTRPRCVSNTWYL